MPITNQSNETAIRYFQPAPVLVKKLPSGTDYYFDVRRAVSLAWVKAEDIQAVLSRRKGGNCCGNKRQLFTEASEEAVRIWEGKPR